MESEIAVRGRLPHTPFSFASSTLNFTTRIIMHPPDDEQSEYVHLVAPNRTQDEIPVRPAGLLLRPTSAQIQNHNVLKNGRLGWIAA